ncbi:hypothetical protein BBBOND_0404510 [Babesia bigemina]|uniref:B30.2/SPRY domain-containing protein n=1 Tax=Babesia bigemina TaxID=5866 RepID=A0A061DE41_BABBI|nr:hypothetical protein BBBOND_0404510 [Babesia bigemina]CDR97964.1 hypothetical protein BBBOND_0404510 [Babesia bigemina]|eukprot:XP_012770150.1 hypothetical protein BBBOND_0404510 [Babesia bigemina]
MWNDSSGNASKAKFKRASCQENETFYLYQQSQKKLVFDRNEEPLLSLRYKDRNIRVLDDRLTAVGYKGWASVFSSHCARKGKWYYEVRILDGCDTINFIGSDGEITIPVQGHVRQVRHTLVGFACRYQKFQVPIGYNNFGYALSDVDGTVVNDGSKSPYAKPFGPGDVIGCYLSLGEPSGVIQDPRKDLKLLEHLQAGILCDPRDPPAMELNAGSYVGFSINGEKFGECGLKVWDGYYHPAAALYMGATVKFNFGPDFDFPPPDDFSPCRKMMLPEVL